MRQNIRLPVAERKHPEIFCFSFIIRTSRSAWLLSKGTRKSSMNANTAVSCFSSRSSKFFAGDCFRRPLFFGVRLSIGGGGLALKPAISMV